MIVVCGFEADVPFAEMDALDRAGRTRARRAKADEIERTEGETDEPLERSTP
jgi:hypothetical protein